MKVLREFWPDLGLIFFSSTLNLDETLTLQSPSKEFTLDSPAVTLVTTGSIEGSNPNRDLTSWYAIPAKVEGGITFPGIYKITALENDTTYVCACFHKSEGKEDMYKLDHVVLQPGETKAYQRSAGVIALVVMAGEVTCNGQAYAPGSRIDVPGSVSVTAGPQSQLTVYQKKA